MGKKPPERSGGKKTMQIKAYKQSLYAVKILPFFPRLPKEYALSTARALWAADNRPAGLPTESVAA